jgi:hypothetical protein
MFARLRQWLGKEPKPVTQQPPRKKSSSLLRLQHNAAVIAVAHQARANHR